MDEEAQPPDSKLTRSKRLWAGEHKFLTEGPDIGRSDPKRLPPSQHLVDGWAVLDLGRQPDISCERWRLKVHGMVERSVTLDWPAFMALPQSSRRTDIHCVTTWSRYDNDRSGVAASDLLERFSIILVRSHMI